MKNKPEKNNTFKNLPIKNNDSSSYSDSSLKFHSLIFLKIIIYLNGMPSSLAVPNKHIKDSQLCNKENFVSRLKTAGHLKTE